MRGSAGTGAIVTRCGRFHVELRACGICRNLIVVCVRIALKGKLTGLRFMNGTSMKVIGVALT